MNALQIRSRKWDYLPDYALAQTPRYTSYPPANRFSAEVDAAAASGALAALPAGATLSLYLHIPFCQKLCWYCGCHTSVPTAADPVDTYVAALVHEIGLVARQVRPDTKVTRIHFGGGSPDILSARQIADIFAALRSAFTISPFAEIAAELDPRGVTPETVRAFAEAGLNRASLGVQVLEAGVQKRMNRIQTRGQIEGAVRLLRAAGVEGLNIDVMYGLPGQNKEAVVETALFAATQDADRVAVFGYAHVPWMKKHQKGISTDDLPVGEVRFRQAEAAAEALEQAGYMAVGFDHFAAPGDSLIAADRQGRLHRNFQGYTDDDATALIGFGASAISSLPSLTYQNTPDSAVYRATVSEGALPVVRGVQLTATDKRIGAVIERILCDFEAVIPADLLASASIQLNAMIADGLLRLDGRTLTVSARGRPYVRNIAAAFDPDFNRAVARHSVAV